MTLKLIHFLVLLQTGFRVMHIYFLGNMSNVILTFSNPKHVFCVDTGENKVDVYLMFPGVRSVCDGILFCMRDAKQVSCGWVEGPFRSRKPNMVLEVYTHQRQCHWS